MTKFLSTQELMTVEEKYKIWNERKTDTTLSKICRDCGRYKKIPIHFCNNCWKEMDKTINK